MEIQIAALNGRVDALEDAVKRLTHDCTEMSKNVDALWNLYKEKMFKPEQEQEQEQKPKPKKRRPKKNGKESPAPAK